MGSPTNKGRDIIIGHANTWHDPAIAIAEDGHLFAEGLERHTQCKRAIDMPRLWYSWRPLKAWLSKTGPWPVEDANVVTISTWSKVGAMDAARSLGNPSGAPFVALVHSSILLEPLVDNQLGWMLRGLPPRPFAPPFVDSPGLKAVGRTTWESKTLMHQLAHAAAAVYTSPFEECAVVVMDGYGEGSAISYLFYQDNKFLLVNQVKPTVSLGLLYGLVTQFCGFDPYQGEEWKVMGLAAFGQKNDAIYRFFKDRIVVDGLDVAFRPVGESEKAFFPPAWAELEKLVGGFRPQGDDDVLRSADLAHNFQRAFEEVVFDVAYNFARLGLSPNLCFTGGCALNSAANGKLVPRSGFEKLHVPMAPGDDGNCLGAVLYEKHYVRKEPRTPALMSPYLGSEMDERRLETILGFGGIKHHRATDERALCEEVSGLLAEGKIVGWVQGRAEFGPRALGNRSILADPRSSSMKDQINRRVKFREFYRPLAPSVLVEHGAEYFEDFQPSPYMERTLKFRAEVAGKVPAVVHQDGTGRLQTVTADMNPLFHRLISAFHAKTGVPMLLNTSFNVMGKPIVHSVEDALAVFYTCGLDRLVVGNYILEK